MLLGAFVLVLGFMVAACSDVLVDSTPTYQTSVGSATLIPRDSSGFPYMVLDGNGNRIVFHGPPDRIVAFDSAAVETLFAIGEGDRLVGTHDFVSYPPEAAGIAKLGDAFNMNLEAILALEPDLVFVFTDTSKADLQRVGLKVLYIESLKDDFRKLAGTIRMWGRITNSLEKAERAAAEFENRVIRIENALESLEKGPTVFHDEGDLWTSGQETLMGEVFHILKLRNIAHDVSGYRQLSPEVIIDRDPEVIIASYGDQISSNPAFSGLTAVREGRVYVPSSDALSIPGPRYIGGIEDLAKWLYPDLFK